MECVCAIAIVGILSAMILPLTANAIASMRASDSMRTRASEASAKNATVATVTDPNSGNYNVKTMYVTVKFDGNITSTAGDWGQESAFSFTESSSIDTKNDVKITYYDLKYGKETEDPTK